jgi:hypothetical protein
MNIDVRVIGITGASRMLLSDTYVTESSLPHPPLPTNCSFALPWVVFYAIKSGCSLMNRCLSSFGDFSHDCQCHHVTGILGYPLHFCLLLHCDALVMVNGLIL